MQDCWNAFMRDNSSITLVAYEEEYVSKETKVERTRQNANQAKTSSKEREVSPPSDEATKGKIPECQ